MQHNNKNPKYGSVPKTEIVYDEGTGEYFEKLW